jgi:transposase InsO family protein
LTHHQARWSLFLSRFNFTIGYRPDHLGGKPDVLSQLSDLKPKGVDNAEQTLLNWEVFKLKATRRGMLRVEGDKELVRQIRESKEFDEELVDAIERLKDGAPTALRRGLEEWNTEDGLILYRGKVYVPKDVELRRWIVELHHDSLPTGHPGQWKTYKLVSQNYWWPGMSVFIEKYVSGCETCARTKNRHQSPAGLLQPNSVPTAPWQIISCDLITQLPKSSGFDAIFVVVDRLTKQAHFIPTMSSVDSPGIAELFLTLVWKLHGTPKEVISDRGPQFAAKFMQQVFHRLGIKSALSTAYHPQTDGQTERVNQELEQYLRAFVNYRQSNWASLLPMAEYAHNTRAHSGTRTSLFNLVYGYEPQFAVLPGAQLGVPAADERMRELAEARKEAEAALEVAAERMKRSYDQGVRETEGFQVGDLVWLEATNIRITHSRKLASQRLGPFKVLEKLGELTYKLDLPFSMSKIHNNFHISLLSPLVPDEIPGRTQPLPPPIVVDGDEEYEVDQVLAVTQRRQKLFFKVHWKGFSEAHDSWEPAKNLENAQDAIGEFYKNNPEAEK